MENAAAPSSTGARLSTSARSSTSSAATSTSASFSKSVIKQRLIEGVLAADHLDRGPLGLVEFVNEDRTRLSAAVCALFPDINEVKKVSGHDEAQLSAFRKNLLILCEEAVVWAQWLLFEGDPETSLAERSGGGRGICGAVWGCNDIAYRCRSCEHDPTCAICVPCFQAGDHRGHDYCMIRTGGGCCDCGDITAWKRTGFCSHHRGPGLVPSLPPTFVTSASAVLETVLRVWASKLIAAHAVGDKGPKKGSLQTDAAEVASQTSLAIIDMLLKFCNSSESMLNFTAKSMGAKDVGILDALFSTESVLQERVVKRLHELLYKLLGDTYFKCSFAQIFVSYYPIFLRDSVQVDLSASGTRSTSSNKSDHAILGNFSVQIFTVPTVTPKLVFESRLLDMLLESLKELFLACVGQDGRLLVSKGPTVHKLFTRVLEDIRYVMSHVEVAQYVAQRRPELARAWVEIVAFVQGMYPQRRVFNIHVEDESEDWETAYLLEMQMAAIHPLFGIGAAFGAAHEIEDNTGGDGTKSADGCANIIRHAKLGRITKKTDGMVIGNGNGVDILMDDVTNAGCAGVKHPQSKNVSRDKEGRERFSCVLPAPLLWIVSECISVLDSWLALDAARELAKGREQSTLDSSSASSAHRRSIWRGRARGLSRGARNLAVLLEPSGLPPASAPIPGLAPSLAPPPTVRSSAERGPERCSSLRDWLRRSRRQSEVETSVPTDSSSGSAANDRDWAEMDMDISRVSDVGRINEGSSEDWWMCSIVGSVGACLRRSVGESWPKVDFDVGRQDVSFHIPLHRMIACLLHKALESHSSVRRPSSSCVSPNNFISLSQLFPDKYKGPHFWALMMEHPLRLQVLCGQVQAGMWRRNGHTTSTLCDLYHTVPWWEDSLELDLLILQCCSVMTPPENFVDRIQSRFGLAEYFNLRLKVPSEYEPNLAHDFLVLLIRVCAERGFCGLSPMEALRRDLVQRLAVGDATHSLLLKALPRRLQDSKHLEECLTSVAVYRNPTGMQQGEYALRQECWCELDLYHPRWSLSALQSAEDRYLRACRTSAIYMQLPRWKNPFAPLQDMGRFVVSARVHDILRSVLFHAAFADNLSTSRAPEGLVFVAVHLLALALDVCSSLAQFKQGGNGGDRHMANHDAGSRQGQDARDPLRSVHGSWSSISGEMIVDEPSLLVLSIERVPVYGLDGNVMPKAESLLSLLVLLLHKYGSLGASSGMRTETTQFSAGDLIKSLLRKFADLRRECMYEIESLAPEILHRRSVKLPTLGTTDGADKDENRTVSDAQKHKEMARRHQQAAMENMKAAQARFAATLRAESHDSDQKDEERSRILNEIGGMRNEESMDTNCALCRDSGSASPLCFLTLVQKSRILVLAQNAAPCWERSSPIGKVSKDKRTEFFGSALGGGNGELWTAAALQNLLHDGLGNGGSQDRMMARESLPEFYRNRLHPSVQTVRLLNPNESPVEAPANEGESSGDSNEIEKFQEGPSFSPNWWEVDSRTTNLEKWGSREIGLVTVLAEYVATVFRDRRKQGGRERPRAVELEERGSGTVRARRVPGRNILDATGNTSLGLSDTAGVYLSACGHAVHQECLDRYFSTLLERFYSRALFEGVQIVDPDMGEFLCPVCRRLANSIIPVFPRSSGQHLEAKALDAGDASMEMGPPRKGSDPRNMESCSSRAIQLQQALRLLSNAENVVSSIGFRKSVNAQLPDSIKGSLDTLSVRLHDLFNPDREHVSGPNGQITQSLHIWDVFRYTLMSEELATRAQEARMCTLGSVNRLLVLEEAVDAGKGSVLPLMHLAARAVQGSSRQVVLLRSRGLQLLVDSVAHGVSRDLFSEESVQGNFPSLVQYLEKAQDSADVQFWKRMTDPVLLHDPFSSLLWSLFSIPLPLPSAEAPFTVLVHLYYVVCLIQVIAYARPPLPSDVEVGQSASSFVKAVQAALHGHMLFPLPRSKYCSVPGCPPIAAFRLLTLPYLRQCFLLRELISASGQVRPVPSAHWWELSQRGGSMSVRRSSQNLAGDSREDELFLSEELEELDELESVFSIPALTAVLNDDYVQGVAINWCHHVRSEAGALSLRQIPRPVGAASFKLMELPSLFQDLLQRYVKERCLRCGNVPDKPALCLMCGTLCCAMSPRSCYSVNNQGECYRHAMACGAGVGVFLMLRKTNILLQRCERQALWPSPYLDAFGEEDAEERGKPLVLSEARYSALTAMVASHGLDYSSLVLARTSRQMPL